ncbi:MAG: hypothetical protein ACPHY8_02365 [Patescibacteria group bacterium]
MFPDIFAFCFTIISHFSKEISQVKCEFSDNNIFDSLREIS